MEYGEQPLHDHLSTTMATAITARQSAELAKPSVSATHSSAHSRQELTATPKPLHNIDSLIRTRASEADSALPIIAYPSEGSNYVFYSPQDV